MLTMETMSRKSREKLSRKSWLRRVGGEESGTAAIEFVVIAPLMVFLLIAVIDAGRMLSNYLTVTHCVREGVRLAGSLADLEAGSFTDATPAAAEHHHLVQTRVSTLLGIDSSELSGTSITSEFLNAGTPTERVSVKVTAQYSAIFPLFNGMPMTISGVGPYLF